MNWYDIRDPDDKKLDELAAKYQFHPLHIEDCRHGNQSAKIEPQDGYLFLVLKPVQLNEDLSVAFGDLDLFLGPDYLVSVQETDCGGVGGLMDRLAPQAGQARADQLFYRIVDSIVDSYHPVLDRISEVIDELEDDALANPEPALLEKLFELRRSLVQLRRVMANTRDVMGHLLRTEYPLVGRDLIPFLRDVYDHIARNLDLIEIHRDLLTGTMELYLSAVANRTNQVMKVLAVFGTIATPALVITGMYGMNIKRLPFAEHPHSWGIVMGMIAITCLIMLLIFRKLRWL